jgi:uncharacterized protein (TIGR02246 family)
MRTKNRALILAFLCLSLATRAAATGDGAADARAAIEKANAAFSQAFEKGDAKALAAMYTADAIVFPPDQEMVKGNEAIGGFWKATHDGGVESAVLTTADVGRSGDVAYEVGVVSLTIRPEGKPAAKVSAKYVVVWKREHGAWKLHRDIWNSLPAPK